MSNADADQRAHGLLLMHTSLPLMNKTAHRRRDGGLLPVYITKRIAWALY
jgi:hypothetical protein